MPGPAEQSLAGETLKELLASLTIGVPISEQPDHCVMDLPQRK